MYKRKVPPQPITVTALPHGLVFALEPDQTGIYEWGNRRYKVHMVGGTGTWTSQTIPQNGVPVSQEALDVLARTIQEYATSSNLAVSIHHEKGGPTVGVSGHLDQVTALGAGIKEDSIEMVLEFYQPKKPAEEPALVGRD